MAIANDTIHTTIKSPELASSLLAPSSLYFSHALAVSRARPAPVLASPYRTDAHTFPSRPITQHAIALHECHLRALLIQDKLGSHALGGKSTTNGITR